MNRQIIYILTGPLASLLTGCVAIYFTFAYDWHGSLKLTLIVFLGSALFDLLINLIPNSTPVQLYDGTITYNDGYSLQQLFYYRRFPKEYVTAVTLHNEERYAEAADLLDKVMASGSKDAEVYRLAFSAWWQVENYDKVKEVSDRFASIGDMSSDDVCNRAIVYTQLGLLDEAIKHFDTSLQLYPHNVYALYNKGYTFIQMNKFADAIPLLDRTIELDPGHSYAWSIRGYCKLSLGQTEEALQDIHHAIVLDPNNSYAYSYLGIYHFDKEEFGKALDLFEKAKDLDDTTDRIDELIENTKQQIILQRSSNRS